MADGSVTTTGLDALLRAVDQLPQSLTARLRQIAANTAYRERTHAQQLLRAQQKTEAHALADAIEVVDDSANKQYLVVSRPPSVTGRYRGRIVAQPADVPIWNEYGTKFMTARPYMRPASAVEADRYRREMEAAATDTARELFK